MRRLATSTAAIGAALLGASAVAPAASHAQQLRFCGPSERQCSLLEVPLDRSGAVPGTIKLQVERSRASRPDLPPLILLVGGPGQSATSVYNSQAVAETLGKARRRRNVIVFDQRGTGLSEALSCTRLQRATGASLQGPGAACARAIGPRRSSYTTRDSADDIEALRRSLGVPEVALLGTSYGTKVALSYAARYPDHVDRLVLDSVVGLDGPSPLYLETMTAVPRVVRELCGKSCRDFARDPVGDLRRLAGRLADGPLRGRLIDARGRPRKASMTDLDLLFLLLAGDLDPSLRSVLPGAVRSAVRGDSAPLLRVIATAKGSPDVEAQESPPREFSAGLYGATSCEELALPWSRTTPPAAHEAEAGRTVRSLPSSAFGPFRPATALASDLVSLCSRWPVSPRAPKVSGPLPDVPVLVLSGAADLRTPLESARKVARSFPRGQLVRIPRTGHDTIASDSTGCARTTMQRFLVGRRSGACSRLPRRPAVEDPAPAALGAVGSRLGRRARTLRAVDLTLRDFAERLEGASGVELERLFSGAAPRPIGTGGLRAGYFRYRIVQDSAALRRFSYVPGVRVSGSLRRLVDNARRSRGHLQVGGKSAVRGTLELHGRTLTGRLGGRRVRLKVSGALAPLRAKASSSAGVVAARADGDPMWRPPHEPIP